VPKNGGKGKLQKINHSLKANEVLIKAPEKCCLISTPELCIRFFGEVKEIFKNKKNVVFDMSMTTLIDETFVAMLLSHIKEKKITNGIGSRIILPEDDDLGKKLKKMGIFKKFDDSDNQFVLDDSEPVTKIHSLTVANNAAKQIVDVTTMYIYGEKRKIKELYSILIELMANTNNHASQSDTPTYSWWLFAYPYENEKKVKFIFLDLGVGIFESLPVRRFIKSNPLIVLNNRPELINYARGEELTKIYSALASGKIKSRTGLKERGKGIPIINDYSKSGSFEEFISISNDAYIDLKNESVSAMSESLSGTFFFFSLKENYENE
jgi:hypothetical protein